jgi:hypothetical protein
MDEMNEQRMHKTYKYKLKYKLKPTTEQVAAMEFIMRRCRKLYNATLQERRDAWQKVRRERDPRQPERPTA